MSKVIVTGVNFNRSTNKETGEIKQWAILHFLEDESKKEFTNFQSSPMGRKGSSEFVQLPTDADYYKFQELLSKQSFPFACDLSWTTELSYSNGKEQRVARVTGVEEGTIIPLTYAPSKTTEK